MPYRFASSPSTLKLVKGTRGQPNLTPGPEGSVYLTGYRGFHRISPAGKFLWSQELVVDTVVSVADGSTFGVGDATIYKFQSNGLPEWKSNLDPAMQHDLLPNRDRLTVLSRVHPSSPTHVMLYDRAHKLHRTQENAYEGYAFAFGTKHFYTSRSPFGRPGECEIECVALDSLKTVWKKTLKISGAPRTFTVDKKDQLLCSLDQQGKVLRFSPGKAEFETIFDAKDEVVGIAVDGDSVYIADRNFSGGSQRARITYLRKGKVEQEVALPSLHFNRFESATNSLVPVDDHFLLFGFSQRYDRETEGGVGQKARLVRLNRNLK